MKIQVHNREGVHNLDAHPGPKLLEHLRDHGIYVNAACGGRGSCQKCRIQVKEGFVGVSSADRQAFSPQELTQGWRLSCQATLRGNVSIHVPQLKNLRQKAQVFPGTADYHELFLACDLGSTGIVVVLANERAEVLWEAHLLNKQVVFGDDVMTRLNEAQNKGVPLLQQPLLQSLSECLEALSQVAPELFKEVQQKTLFCAGNSAMTSFLNGWDIKTLAVSPYQPLKLDPDGVELNGLHVESLPLMGGFVGGDTYAGILAVEALKPELPWMLVDIGTNTEIVLKNSKGEFWFSSAPAGPAFEGGNITKGMRAEPGAISEARYENGSWNVQTIGGDLPVGICGSGLIDIIFEAVKAGLIKVDGFIESGRMEVVPDVPLVADDIREFQLAKSATRTACDLIVDRAGESPKTLFLAGTFASHLRLEAVVGIGLLPANIELKIIGNSSLKGTMIYSAMDRKAREKWRTQLSQSMRSVELALQDDFQDAFVRNLSLQG